MEQINERFREFRERLKISQKALGDALGLSNSGISNIEKGIRSVTDKHIKLLCATFNANEEWLRNGTEPIFKESNSTIISQLADEYDLDVYEKAMISSFLKLKPEQRQFVRNWIKNAMDEISADKSISNKKDMDAEITAETTPDLSAMRVVNRDEEEEKLIARGVELMREQFKLEKKREA